MLALHSNTERHLCGPHCSEYPGADLDVLLELSAELVGVGRVVVVGLYEVDNSDAVSQLALVGLDVDTQLQKGFPPVALNEDILLDVLVDGLKPKDDAVGADLFDFGEPKGVNIAVYLNLVVPQFFLRHLRKDLNYCIILLFI